MFCTPDRINNPIPVHTAYPIFFPNLRKSICISWLLFHRVKKFTIQLFQSRSQYRTKFFHIRWKSNQDITPNFPQNLENYVPHSQILKVEAHIFFLIFSFISLVNKNFSRQNFNLGNKYILLSSSVQYLYFCVIQTSYFKKQQSKSSVDATYIIVLPFDLI